MADVTVYIDGFNLYYGAVRGRPGDRWLDVLSLSRSLVPGDSVALVRYFTARVAVQQENPDAPARQRAYLRVLEDHESLVVKYGRFTVRKKWRALAEDDFELPNLFRPELSPAWAAKAVYAWTKRRDSTHRFVRAHVQLPEEKGSDVNLASHLLRDIYERGVRSALVISNDTDLCEPIRIAAENGVHVRICNPGGGGSAGGLRKVASEVVLLDKSTLWEHQLSDPYVLRNGKRVARPPEWA